MKRLNDNSDVPEARRGILPKTYTSSKKKTRLLSTFPAEEWVLLAASTKEPEEIEFVVDSGARMHMVSKKDLFSAELETVETSPIHYLMGRRPMKDVLGNHLKDRLFHLVHWLSITL